MNYLKRIIFDFVVNYIAPAFWLPGAGRRYIYKVMRIDIRTSQIKKRCYFNTNQVSIGEGSLINTSTKFFSSINQEGKISIGQNCYIAMNCILITNTHEIGDENKRAGKDIRFPISIDNGCWIGANSTILPGVSIGKGCIIAAGSVVNKDCAPNGLYAGVPAKRIKELDVTDGAAQFVAASVQP